MSDYTTAQKLENVERFLKEIAGNEAFETMKTAHGWPIRQQARGFANDVAEAIKVLRRPAKKD